MQRYNKNVIAWYEAEGKEAFFTEEGEYLNLHIVGYPFENSESNTLQEQIPKENFKEEYKTDIFLHCKILEFKLWEQFSTNEKVLSFNVSCYNNSNDTELF